MMAIQKLTFNLPHVRVLVTHNCGKILRDAFKRCAKFQDVLCRWDYAERVVAIFTNQIQSEYYGRNIYIYIEGIKLEHLSPIETATATLSHTWPTRNYMFNYIFSDNSKHD